MPATDQIAFDVLRYNADQRLQRYQSGLAEVARRVPLDSTGGLHVELPDYVSGAGAPFATVGDYAAGLERLQGFSGYLDTLVARLREGQRLGYHQPRIVVEKVIGQANAMLALPLAESPFLAALQRFPEEYCSRRALPVLAVLPARRF